MTNPEDGYRKLDYRLWWSAKDGKYFAAVVGAPRIRMSGPDPVAALTELLELIKELRDFADD